MQRFAAAVVDETEVFEKLFGVFDLEFVVHLWRNGGEHLRGSPAPQVFARDVAVDLAGQVVHQAGSAVQQRQMRVQKPHFLLTAEEFLADIDKFAHEGVQELGIVVQIHIDGLHAAPHGQIVPRHIEARAGHAAQADGQQIAKDGIQQGALLLGQRVVHGDLGHVQAFERFHGGKLIHIGMGDNVVGLVGRKGGLLDGNAHIADADIALQIVIRFHEHIAPAVIPFIEYAAHGLFHAAQKFVFAVQVELAVGIELVPRQFIQQDDGADHAQAVHGSIELCRLLLHRKGSDLGQTSGQFPKDLSVLLYYIPHSLFSLLAASRAASSACASSFAGTRSVSIE